MVQSLIDDATLRYLSDRLGENYAKRRLEIENRHHQRVLTFGRKFLHIENWYSIHGVMRNCFRALGLHQRGQENARKIRLTQNTFHLPKLPAAFDGLRLLHLSDLHLDMDRGTTHALIETLRDASYDICVLTGDYRANTFGDSQRCMDILEQVRLHLPDPVYAVLGNHDSLLMLPRMEDMGIKVLMNENVRWEKNGEQIFLCGIDDAHYFQLHDIKKACADIPDDTCKILLSHTPETYQQAANCGVDLFFCGHTHGGQICLPGGYPLILEARCPRHLGKGKWHYNNMQGYTSVGASTSVINLRFNCPPEITLHILNPEQA